MPTMGLLSEELSKVTILYVLAKSKRRQPISTRKLDVKKEMWTEVFRESWKMKVIAQNRHNGDKWSVAYVPLEATMYRKQINKSVQSCGT